MNDQSIETPGSRSPQLRRSVGFWAASGVMVGVMIGSGIFATPPNIANLTESTALVLVCWELGGVLSFFGAVTFAELATMYPQSGGVYVFIREAFGRSTAFVFGWSYMLLVKPFAAGGIAMVFSGALHDLIRSAYPGTTTPELWDPRITTCLMIVASTFVNARGVRLGAGVATVLTAFKVAALIAIVVLTAMWTGVANVPAAGASTAAGAPATADASGVPVQSVFAVIVAIMALVLWTYDGWSDVGAIAGEVRQPQKMLPRIYLVGTLGVMALYLLVNVAYFKLVPIEEMRRAGDSVAPIVADRLVGTAGAWAVTVLVILSTLGSTHSSILTGARVTYAQAKDGLMFRFLAGVSPTCHTPHVALWVQCMMSCMAVLFLGGFSKLAGGFTFTMWIFYGLAGAGIFVLRRRLPNAERPFRCWGYPVVPALFVLSAIGMTVGSVMGDPAQNLMWIGVLAAGWPVYWVWDAMTRPGREI